MKYKYFKFITKTRLTVTISHFDNCRLNINKSFGPSAENDFSQTTDRTYLPQRRHSGNYMRCFSDENVQVVGIL